jgi:hypothetical protein
VEDRLRSASSAQPPAGSDLSVTGHVYLEETGPVVWTGPCQGTLTVVAQTAPAVTDDSDALDRGVRISAAVLIAVAVVCLALVPITARRRDRRAGPSSR